MHCSKVSMNTTRIIIPVEAEWNIRAVCTRGSGAFFQGRKLCTNCCILSDVFPTKGTCCRAVYYQTFESKFKNVVNEPHYLLDPVFLRSDEMSVIYASASSLTHIKVNAGLLNHVL